MEAKVLLAGESWITTSTHLKGFDFFSSTHDATGGDFLIAALSAGGAEVTDQDWPYLPGFNEVMAKEGAEVLATVGEDPLLVTGSFGKGRSVAWTSDVGPHWCPKDFVDWSGYNRLWQQIVGWAASVVL